MGLSYSCMEIISSVMQPSVIREDYADGRSVTTKQYNPWLSSIGCISATIILLALMRPTQTYQCIDKIKIN